MDEYVSREDVLKKAKSSISVPADNEWDCGYNTAMAEMLEFIKQLPSADVQSVKHGQWTRIDDEYGHDYVCSVCNNKNDRKSHYCPDCGARMSEDGDTNETD